MRENTDQNNSEYGLCQTFKMERLANIVNDYKRSLLDIWQGSKYAFVPTQQAWNLHVKLPHDHCNWKSNPDLTLKFKVFWLILLFVKYARISSILSLYGKIRAWENPYFGIIYAVLHVNNWKRLYSLIHALTYSKIKIFQILQVTALLI